MEKKIKTASLYGEMKSTKETRKTGTAVKPRTITKSDIIRAFQDYNERHGISYGFQPKDVPELSAVIVYDQSNFTKEYSETSRSYRVTSQSGKAFFHGMMGNSIYGECLDGSEDGVRLDAYAWKVERCYFE